MVRAGVKLTSAQRKLLSDAERKEVRKLRKEFKKVRPDLGGMLVLAQAGPPAATSQRLPTSRTVSGLDMSVGRAFDYRQKCVCNLTVHESPPEA
jgi:hypothetical protein